MRAEPSPTPDACRSISRVDVTNVCGQYTLASLVDSLDSSELRHGVEALLSKALHCWRNESRVAEVLERSNHAVGASLTGHEGFATAARQRLDTAAPQRQPPTARPRPCHRAFGCGQCSSGSRRLKQGFWAGRSRRLSESAQV